MSGKDDVFAVFAGNIQNHIVGISGILLLLQGDDRGLSAGLYQLNGILGVDVDTQHFLALVYILSQLPLINIPVGVIGVAVIGDKAYSAIFQQILVLPVAQIAVKEDDLTLALAKTAGGIVPQIVNRCLHGAGTGAEISLAGDLRSVNGQSGGFHIGHGNGKRFQGGLKTQFFTLCLQIESAAQLFRGAAGADISGIGKDPLDGGLIHRWYFLSFFFHYSTGKTVFPPLKIAFLPGNRRIVQCGLPNSGPAAWENIKTVAVRGKIVDFCGKW